MVAVAVVALCLTVSTVLTHVAGFSLTLMYLHRARKQDPLSRGWAYIIGHVLALILVVISLHVIEVAMWAMCFLWIGAFPDAATALLVSLGSYSTVGSGQVVLPGQWQMLSGVEGLVGTLMFGLSTALIFAVLRVIDQMWQSRTSESNP